MDIASRIVAQGPHQYLATNPTRDRVYATTWADPPSLSAWALQDTNLVHVNTVPITATSSYVSYYNEAVYSAGGPTGEVHRIDPTIRGFGEKLQELLFVSADELPKADKTRKALRYGSHGADVDPHRKKAFVPHLGSNSIWMYNVESDGTLKLLDEVQAHREADAPRHNIPSPDGRRLYSVTEHTSYVDVWDVQDKTLSWRQSVSIIPPDANRDAYRGDTLRLSRSGRTLFASTRGKTTATRGYVAAWSVDPSTGILAGLDGDQSEAAALARYQTRNSGGKANAIEPAPPDSPLGPNGEEWLVLTDDEEGWVSILAWDGSALEEAAWVQLVDGDMASHAVWLS